MYNNPITYDFRSYIAFTCDKIRPNYHHVKTCMEAVPEAITAFWEGDSFEEVMRTAVSLGDDFDTLTAIATSIAEGFYGIPQNLKEERYNRLADDLKAVLKEFENVISKKISIGNIKTTQSI